MKKKDKTEDSCQQFNYCLQVIQHINLDLEFLCSMLG